MRFPLALVACFFSLALTAATTDNSFIAISRPFPVVGYLEKRGKIITFKAGVSGPILSVEEKGGKMLAEDVTEEELKRKDPGLYQLVQSAIASGEPGSFIDASAAPKPNGIQWKLPMGTNDEQ
ncbi:MAG: hypothetical protein H6617_03740 [Bdellovibrionaceae bacterium]|nr:hypothetical protein [Bdellovibrionales bacterium]MCB9253771.1 hypothetical protein [Pseudobdellovibrionaceae bacterium]